MSSFTTDYFYQSLTDYYYGFANSQVSSQSYTINCIVSVTYMLDCNLVFQL
jgi:hypothetical protein